MENKWFFLQFSVTTEYIAPCFNDTLVQANMDNKRQVLDMLDKTPTVDMANYTTALIEAFRLLDTVCRHYTYYCEPLHPYLRKCFHNTKHGVPALPLNYCERGDQ